MKKNDKHIYKEFEDLKQKYIYLKKNNDILFKSSKQVIVIIEPIAGKIIEANDIAIDFFGYPKEDLLSLKMSDVCELEEETQISDVVNSENKLNKEWTCLLKLNKDKTAIVSIGFKDVIIENQKLFYVFINDVSDLKNTQKELSERELLIQRITEQSPNVIYIFDVEKDKNIFINKDLRQILGYSEFDFSNDSSKIISELIHPEDLTQFLEYQKTTANWTKEYTLTFDMRLKGKNGKWRWFIGQEREFLRQKGKIINTIGVLTDITDLKNVENELKLQNEEYQTLNEEFQVQNDELKLAKQKSEKSNHLKNEFLHNLSHEVRTPMNGIIGFAEMLNEKNVSENNIKFYSKIILNCSNQLLRIIDDIIEISKLETKQVKLIEKEICLNQLLNDIFSIYNIKSKEYNLPLFLKNNIPKTHSKIFIDESKLQKIITNLLDNALKYTFSGYVELGTKLNDNELQVFVKDTGIGIAPKNEKIIFERFRQVISTNEEMPSRLGLGLGLSIAKENADLIGVGLSFDSKLKKGTTFTINIPYNKIIIEGKRNKILDVNKMPLTNSKILVAEDEEINFLYIDILIKKEYPDIQIIHAKNGLEAVEFCQKDKDIALVFMDIKMPIMNGYEATSKIKKVKGNLPIIALTAYTTDEDKILAIENGFSDFLTKPINKKKFLEIIKKNLFSSN